MSAVGDARKRQDARETDAYPYALYDAVVEVLAAHLASEDYKCSCGHDCFGATAAYSWTLYQSHVAGIITGRVEEFTPGSAS